MIEIGKPRMKLHCCWWIIQVCLRQLRIQQRGISFLGLSHHHGKMLPPRESRGAKVLTTLCREHWLVPFSASIMLMTWIHICNSFLRAWLSIPYSEDRCILSYYGVDILLTIVFLTHTTVVGAVYIYLYIYIYTYVNIYWHVYIYIWMYVYMYMYTYIYILASESEDGNALIQVRLLLEPFTYIHIYMYIYMYT